MGATPSEESARHAQHQAMLAYTRHCIDKYDLSPQQQRRAANRGQG